MKLRFFLPSKELSASGSIVHVTAEDIVFRVAWNTVPRDVAAGVTTYVTVNAADGLHSFFSHVLALEPYPQVKVALPRTIEHIQRREFVRVDVRLPITLVSRIEDGTERTMCGHSQNLSAGGVLAIFPKEEDLVPVGTLVNVHFELLPVAKQMIVSAKVVRSSGSNRGELQLAMAFLGLNQRDEGLIFRFVFHKQNELRRRGLM